MSSRPQINVGVVGHDGVSPVFKKIGKEAHGLRGMLKLAFATGPLANGMEGLVHSVLNFGEESVNKFEEVGKEILKLRRITGGTAEETSKMRFAFEETGLTVDDAARSLKKFSTAAISKKGLSEIGVNAMDAHKQLRPMNDLLLDVADKFAAMPNGIRKTAEATKLFGRAGLQLLPFLNKGSKGLKEFFDQADKYGLVFNEKDLKTTQEQVMAQREWTAAITGFQVQLGRYILPYMTKWLKIVVEFAKKHLPDFQNALKYLSGVFRRDILPVLKDMVKFIVDNKDAIVEIAKTIIPLIVAWKVYTTAILAFNAAMKIATGLQLAFNAAQAALGFGGATAAVESGAAAVAGGAAAGGATVGGEGILAALGVGALAEIVIPVAIAALAAGGVVLAIQTLLDKVKPKKSDQDAAYHDLNRMFTGGGLYDFGVGSKPSGVPTYTGIGGNPNFGSASYTGIGGGSGSLPPITVGTVINLDGKVIANSTEKYMYESIKAHGKTRLRP
jgi:hypothetical protein